MPMMARMSWGAGLPSMMYSPFWMKSPSCTGMCLPFGTMYSIGSRPSSTGSMVIRRLFLKSLPKCTWPEISAMIAWSLGRRASKSSATRGRPPVMSLVFAPSRGMRAMTSPGCSAWPSSTERIASTDMAWTSGLPFASRTGSPVAGSMTMTSGLRSLPRGAARQSETIFWLMPVASSISSRTEKPGDEVDELRDARLLGDDRQRVGIPLGELVAARDRRALLGQELGAVAELVHRPVDAVLVDDRELHGARHDDLLAVGVGEQVGAAELQRALLARLEERLRCRPARCRRCGRSASSAACRARRSTGRR